MEYETEKAALDMNFMGFNHHGFCMINVIEIVGREPKQKESVGGQSDA